MRNRHSIGPLSGFCLLLSLCAGCINYEEDISLKKDCSGTITMHYWVSEKFAAIAEQKEKEARGEKGPVGLPFSEDQAGRVFNIEKVISIQSGPTIDKTREKGYRHITITCEFDDINNPDFPTIPLFEGGSISFTVDEQGNMVFKRVLRAQATEEPKTEGEGQGKDEKQKEPAKQDAAAAETAEMNVSLDEDASDPGDTLAKSVFSEYKLKFVVNFPGRILKTNGNFYEEGEEPSRFEWFWGRRKAVWEFRLSDIAKKGELTATVRVKWPISWIVITVIVIVALALIIIKSKPGASEAELQDAEKARAEEEKAKTARASATGQKNEKPKDEKKEE